MAKNSVIEITDEFAKSFRVMVSTGFCGGTRGDWKAIDMGFIRYNSGYVANLSSKNSTLVHDIRHVCLFAGGGLSSALTLNEFETFFGVNAGGTGYVFHDWVIGLRAGLISWSRVG